MALLSVSNASSAAPTLPEGAPFKDRLSAALAREAHLPPAQISMARHLANAQQVPVSQVILANGWAEEASVLQALSRVHCAQVLDLYKDPVDEDLAKSYPVEACLAAGAVPWRRIGTRVAFATWNPQRFQRHLGALKATGAEPVLALAPRHQVTHATEAIYGRNLIRQAQYTLPRQVSARDLALPSLPFMVWALSLIIAAVLAFPGAVVLCLAAAAAFVSIANMAFKSVLMFASLKSAGHDRSKSNVTQMPLGSPRFSLLIPLLSEAEVAETLLTQLRSLKYPSALTEVFFLLESDDHLTRNTLSRLHLPYSFQILTVPPGDLRTKPRALNYALPFTSGDIIGVYDAEDRPDPGQLRKVVEGFRNAEPRVACLQGRLGFFNVRTNLLSRCFCIEYAGWFSVFLRGLERLDLPIPLGGTTLFFKRAALIDCGGWDAHNVTEDADLGMRLYRHGYRTGLIDSDTLEEANCRVWPWIRQRSRWIKGYMVTWRIHMRRPHELIQDMGGRATAAFHILFLGSILAAMLTPVHFLFWLAFFGAPVPGLAELRPDLLRPLGAGFLALGALNIGFWIVALRRTHQRKLMIWLPAMQIYFMMSGVAAVKAGIETLVHPHFWDKTRHGIDV